MRLENDLVRCLELGQATIYRNDAYRAMVIDSYHSRSIAIFTPTEYRLLEHLLTGQAASDTTLIQEVYNTPHSETEKNRLEKHVDNIRNKLPGEVYIYRISAYGYILLESRAAALAS